MHATIIGLDVAKNVFQLHAEDVGGNLLWRKRLRREELVPFLRDQTAALIGIEACGSAHYWGREMSALGHEVRLMPARYVKAYVKRGKSDLRDAAAICEAVQRPNMRFVPIKSVEQQTGRALERSRELLTKQSTQMSNAIRGLLAELGVVAGVGLRGFKALAAKIDAGDAAIPATLLDAVRPLVEHWRSLRISIDALERRLVQRAKSDARMRKLQQIPSIGPLGAHALVTAIGNPHRFSTARDCPAWIGLTPLTDSSGEKNRIGHISRQGDHALRRLLVLGAANLVRRAKARPDHASPWLNGLLARRPVKVATVAQAAKTARIAWAMLCSGEDYREKPAAK